MHLTQRLRRSAAVLVAVTIGAALGGLPAATAAPRPTGASSAPGRCDLTQPDGRKVEHVIYVNFDNTHLTRDNPNVPSDLEQMPHLLSFIEGNGTMLANHHTPLISHTGTDILTALSGVYGDRHGIPVSNSFRYFNPDGSTDQAGSFAYWTDPLNSFAPTPTDTTPHMIDDRGKTAPAPWVPWTRAGCDVGAVAAANTVLENIGTDIPTVFGAGSPEAAEVAANPAQATADFVGVAVHCAKSGTACAAGANPKPDLLPDEPGGYDGFQALYGHKYVKPAISPGPGDLKDLDGTVISDGKGHVGFPGFDGMSASVSLAYTAAMQEHGVPVTYAYISDAHDNHAGGGAYGPGEAGYVAALKAYDHAFAEFFARLAADGINQSNTLFAFTADENDHFVGVQKQGCDGVTIPCTYATGEIGELNANLTGLLATQRHNTTAFTVHADSAPTIYVTGHPARDAAVTRQLERDLAALKASNPFSGNPDETIANDFADPVEMRLLHMVTHDPARTPTVTMFAKPDYFLFTGPPDCATTPAPSPSPCVQVNRAFAWNHGDNSPDIVTTWLGMVGPGVRQLGVDTRTWSDHTDIRPTILALTGLRDDYRHDGRVLVEDLDASALPASLSTHGATLLRLAQVYKQLNACVGQFGEDTLHASTKGIVSGSSGDDRRYQLIEAALAGLGTQRDRVAGRMVGLLDAAAFGNRPIPEPEARGLIAQGEVLLALAHQLAVHA
jgi:hypothetical protein